MAGSANGSNALAQWQQLAQAQGVSGQPEAHMKALAHKGLPSRRHEDWKYLPLDNLLNNQFVAPAPDPLRPEVRDSLALPLDALRLVFVDGLWQPELSDSLEEGGVSVAIERHPQLLAAPVNPEPFLHLTEGLARQMMTIRVSEPLARPLYLLHITRGCASGGLATVHYRCHLTVESGADVTVIEHFASIDARSHFTGSRLTMEVADNARLRHFKLGFENPASYHFSHNDLWMAESSQVSSTSFLLGAQLTRHHTSCRMEGENASLQLDSLALPIGQEVVDSRTWLAHNKGYCLSRQRHKTIVRDRGRAVFTGLIRVAQHAVKTDGQMTNNNLLLSRMAEADTRPQLEIYADDVKCSHGATVGRLDEDQLFYLRSRGIPEAEAREMIIFAFASALTDDIEQSELRDAVLERIRQRISQG
ncbi:FeS cluster assembly protein SufD [Salmonella enterica subsp. enterica serovar Choleraesuis]|nr:FeS cluster assembly protein SufD [Salmonella enterica subsp. enterica serovar Choleraesuis]